MKENTMFIVKEVAICLGIAIIAVGVNVFLLKNYVSANITIDSAKTNLYSSIDKSRYVLINADIQEEQNPTQKFETANQQLDNYQTEYRYIPGTINPFVSTDSVNDLPTEVVGVSASKANDENN